MSDFTISFEHACDSDLYVSLGINTNLLGHLVLPLAAANHDLRGISSSSSKSD